MARQTGWINWDVVEAILWRHGQEEAPWAVEARPYVVREVDFMAWVAAQVAQGGRGQAIATVSGDDVAQTIRNRGQARALVQAAARRSPPRGQVGRAASLPKFKPPPPGAIVPGGQGQGAQGAAASAARAGGCRGPGHCCGPGCSSRGR